MLIKDLSVTSLMSI